MRDLAGLAPSSVTRSVGAFRVLESTTSAVTGATMHAAQLANAAIFTHVESDENGEARVVAMTAHDVGQAPRSSAVPRLRVIATFDETPSLRRRTFANNPFCVHCDELLESADVGAVVPTEEGPRIAHRVGCFAQAMIAHQPEMAVRAAIGRAGRGC